MHIHSNHLEPMVFRRPKLPKAPALQTLTALHCNNSISKYENAVICACIERKDGQSSGSKGYQIFNCQYYYLHF